jgi:hypothetical protein
MQRGSGCARPLNDQANTADSAYRLTDHYRCTVRMRHPRGAMRCEFGLHSKECSIRGTCSGESRRESTSLLPQKADPRMVHFCAQGRTNEESGEIEFVELKGGLP